MIILYQAAVKYFQNCDPLTDDLTPDVATHVQLLFNNPIVQETLSKYSQFQLPDSTY